MESLLISTTNQSKLLIITQKEWTSKITLGSLYKGMQTKFAYPTNLNNQKNHKISNDDYKSFFIT